MNEKSLPYTGGSSASFASDKALQVAQAQEAKKRENADKRAKLLPSGDIVSAEIQKEIDELRVIDFVQVKAAIAVGNNALEIEILANEKAIEKLNQLKTRLTNMLRDNKE